MRSRTPHNLQAVHSQPKAAEAAVATDFSVKHRALPPRCIAPTTTEHHRQNLVGRTFLGRWLLISEAGDCLLDYTAGTCDALPDMPLGASCSLVAAILQFVMAVQAPPASPSISSVAAGTSTHTVMLGGLLLSICRASGFSVVAATTAAGRESTECCVDMPDMLPTISTAYRYKAMEIQRGLSAAVGPALQSLVESSASRKEDQVNSYTLSSMLDSAECDAGESIEHLMDPKTSALARDVLSSALRRTYRGLLEQALLLLRRHDNRPIESMCIFDTKLDLLARLTVPADSPSSSSSLFSEKSDWRGSELVRVAAEKPVEEESKFTFWCWAHGKRDFVAALGPPVGPLRVAAQLRAGMGADIPLRSTCGDTLGIVQMPLRWDVYDGAVWAVLEVSRVLADAFGMPFEWPADISRNNMEITWDREVGQRAASPPTLDPACVSLDYSSDVAPLSPLTPQKFQNWATWSPQQRSPCSEPHSPGPFAVAPTPGCAAGAPASLTGGSTSSSLSSASTEAGSASAVAPTLAQVVAAEAARGSINAAVSQAISKVLKPRAAEASAQDYCTDLLTKAAQPRAAEASAKDYCASLLSRVQTKSTYKADNQQ